jgi:alkyl sulfatase BDS1-like metallo-beta-lactamase superfamily hydrolase
LLPHDVPVGCDAAMLALKNAFHHQAAHDVRIDAEVRFDTDTFRITLDDGAIDIARGPARHPDLVMHIDPQTLEELAFAGRSVRAAERSGTFKLEGDRTQLEQLLRLFAARAGP